MRTSVVRLFAVVSFVFALSIGACTSGDNDDGDTDAKSSGELHWQDPPSDLYVHWEEAVSYCESLELDGHDDWRLPNIDELRSIIRGCDATETGGSCDIVHGCPYECYDMQDCVGCDPNEGPAAGGYYWPEGMHPAEYWSEFWSSSPVQSHVGFLAWTAEYTTGWLNATSIDNNRGVRCVR